MWLVRLGPACIWNYACIEEREEVERTFCWTSDGFDLCLVWVEWYGMSMYVMYFFENMKVHWLCLTGFLVHDCVLLTPSMVQDHHLLLRLLLFNTVANEEHLMAWDKTAVIRLDSITLTKTIWAFVFSGGVFFTMMQRAKVSFSDCKVLFGCFFLKNQDLFSIGWCRPWLKCDGVRS